MPETTNYSRAPIPLGSEPDQVPADLKRYANHVDPMLNLKAADVAERNALYGDVPVGTLVSATAQEAIWRKTATGWKTVWSDTGWVEVNYYSGFVPPSSRSGLMWRRVGDLVSWKGLFIFPTTYTGGSHIHLCNVPTDARPPIENARWPSSGSSGLTCTINYAEGRLTAWCEGPSGAWWGAPPSYLVE